MQSRFHARRAVAETWLPRIAAVAVLWWCYHHVAGIYSSAFGHFPLPGDNLWRNNGTQALELARNWYSRGLLESGLLPRFGLGSPDAPLGYAYLSYPPGFVLVPWFVATLSGHAPSLVALMRIGEAWMLISAALVTCLVFTSAALLRLPGRLAALPAIASGAVALLLPGTHAYVPFAWWADIVVLPPFLALLACETVSQRWEDRPWFRVLRAAVIVAGVFSDWLFFFLLAALLLRDLTAKPRRVRRELWAIPLAYFALHAALVYRAGAGALILQKFSERTGVAGLGHSLSEGAFGWHIHLNEALGNFGEALYFLSVAAAVPLTWAFFRRNRFDFRWRSLVETAFCALLPLHLHCLFFRQHYYEHSYEAAKFALVLPLLWLGLLPLALLERWRSPAARAATLAALGAASVYLAVCAQGLEAHFFASPFSISPTLQNYCLTVAEHSRAGDVAFSPQFGTFDFFNQRTDLKEKGLIHDWARDACGREVYVVNEPADLGKLYQLLHWQTRFLGGQFRLVFYTVGIAPLRWEEALEPGAPEFFGPLQARTLKPGSLLLEGAESN